LSQRISLTLNANYMERVKPGMFPAEVADFRRERPRGLTAKRDS